MPPTNPINIPAGYAPAFAIGFSEANGDLAIVQDAKPLPVLVSTAEPLAVQSVPGHAPAALAGTAAADTIAGPFTPASGRPVILTLAGDWEGSVRLERSADGGTTRHALTAGGLPWGQYGANICEPVWSEAEDGAQLWLAITISSGAVEYRVAQ